MLRLGCCTGGENLALAAAAGCDYIEMGFGSVTDMPEEDYVALLKQVNSSTRKVEAMNGFLPGRFRITGPVADPAAALAFAEKGMSRAAALGVQYVVFGSAGARNVPEGFPMETAQRQLAAFAAAVAAVAKQHGITIVLEPLRKAESNILHTVDEGLAIYRLAGKPEGLAVLADMYHMVEEGEDFSSIRRAGVLLRHCHIANPAGRRAPLPEDTYDYAPFFRALADIGYEGRVSIEGNIPDMKVTLPRSIACLKKWINRQRTD